MKMQVPAGSGGVSFDGEFYEADKGGFVNVPGESIPDLLAHGCTVAGGNDGDIDKGAALADAVKAAKEALKADKDNADKKTALDDAVKALSDFRAANK